MRDGRASQTAIRIAQLIVHLSQRPSYRSLIPPDTAAATRALLASTGLLRLPTRLALRSPLTPPLIWVLDRVMGGGTTIHFPLRKCFIEDSVRDAIRDGAERLLVIGAGLDTLALRLASEQPALHAVEVDHPASSATKARGISGAGLGSPNLTLVAKDLSVHPLSSALSEAGWQRGPSVVVAEGLLMYLPPDAVRALFSALHAQTGPGSRVVFTWLPRSRGDMLLSPIIRAGVALVGEPVRFSVSLAGLSELLEDTGWVLLPATDLHERYLQGTPLAGESVTPMEHFSVAQWATRTGTGPR